MDVGSFMVRIEKGKGPHHVGFDDLEIFNLVQRTVVGLSQVTEASHQSGIASDSIAYRRIKRENHFVFVILSKARREKGLLGRVDKEQGVSPGIEFDLFRRQQRVDLLERLQENFFIDKGKEGYALPRLFFPIHVDQEGFRIKFNDGR